MSRSTDDKSFLGQLNAEWQAAKDYEKTCKGNPDALKAAKASSSFASKKLRTVQELFAKMNTAEKAVFMKKARDEKIEKMHEEIQNLKSELKWLEWLQAAGTPTKHKQNLVEAQITKLRALVAAT